MNSNSNIKRARFAIDYRDASTVFKSLRRPDHDLTILNILKSLKDLKTVAALFPIPKYSSKPIIMMIESNILNPSLR